MNNNRCHLCKKKISLVESLIPCRCQENFCQNHMNNHECKFDYKLKQQDILVKQLVPTSGIKVEKI